MDFRKFVMALSNDELKILSDAVYQEKLSRAEMRVRNDECESLNDTEKALICESWIAAVKAYRDRTGASFVEAKYLVDRYRHALLEKR